MDVKLLSDGDGRYDPDVALDDDDDYLVGDPKNTSTYSLCWAPGPYEDGSPPTSDSDFIHTSARIFVQHECADAIALAHHLHTIFPSITVRV